MGAVMLMGAILAWGRHALEIPTRANNSSSPYRLLCRWKTEGELAGPIHNVPSEPRVAGRGTNLTRCDNGKHWLGPSASQVQSRELRLDSMHEPARERKGGTRRAWKGGDPYSSKNPRLRPTVSTSSLWPTPPSDAVVKPKSWPFWWQRNEEAGTDRRARQDVLSHAVGTSKDCPTIRPLLQRKLSPKRCPSTQRPWCRWGCAAIIPPPNGRQPTQNWLRRNRVLKLNLHHLWPKVHQNGFLCWSYVLTKSTTP